jgi:hypothetical protein
MRENLKMFPPLLGVGSEDRYQQVFSLIENHVEELQNGIKHYFPVLSFQHKCMTR